MKASDLLIRAIKQFEGCRLTAYQDGAGIWTIGYGHTAGVRKGDRINQETAERYLREDLAKFEAVAAATPGVRTQGQFDAVTDFCYNCGPGNFRSSTLRRYIVAGRKTWEIQEQFLLWVNVNRVKQGGLVSRRIWEAARWNDPE